MKTTATLYLASTICACSLFHSAIYGEGGPNNGSTSFTGEAKRNITKYTMTAGTTYRVRVQAKGFTPAVYLMDRFSSVRNAEARRTARAATVVYTPKRTQEFRIMVSPAYNGMLATGKLSYELSIDKATFKDVKDFQGTLPLAEHKVALKAGTGYAISVRSRTFSPMVRVVDGTKTAVTRTGQKRGREYITNVTYTPTVTGTYRVIVEKPSYSSTNDEPMSYLWQLASLKPSLFVKGKWTAQDPTYRQRKGSHFKVHEVKMTAGQIYQIDLNSSLDTYLFLENKQGQIVDQDDDGGGGLNSRLNFRPKQTGTYRVIATTYGAGRTGNYTLRVQHPGQTVGGRFQSGKVTDKVFWLPLIKGTTYRLAGQASEFTPSVRIRNDYNPVATESALGKEKKAAVVYTAESTHDGYLQIVPTREAFIGQGPYKFNMSLEQATFSNEHKATHQLSLATHTVTLKKNQGYRLRAVSKTFSPQVRWADEAEILSQGSAAFRRNNEYKSSLVVFPLQTTKYRLLVDRYTFARALVPQAPTYTLDVTPLVPVFSTAGKLQATDPKRRFDRYYKVHEYKMLPNRLYYVTVTSDDFSPSVELENTLKVVVRSDTYNDSRTSRLSYRTYKNGGTFRIIVTSYDAKRVGGYRVTVLDAGAQ